jgi:hypothetical protein
MGLKDLGKGFVAIGRRFSGGLRLDVGNFGLGKNATGEEKIKSLGNKVGARGGNSPPIDVEEFFSLLALEDQFSAEFMLRCPKKDDIPGALGEVPLGG